MKSTTAPRHIGIIMDGNGRWAQKRGLIRIQGHRQGARVVRKIAQACAARNVEILTLYAFSSENWSRPPREVDMLMKLLKIYASRERERLLEDNVRLKLIGNLSRIPDRVRAELERTVKETSVSTGLTLQLALSYSGRDEILRAFQKLYRNHPEALGDLSEEVFESYLDTAHQPAPDLIVRTSGEQRLSNFLIWQSAYSEFYFTDCLWPDFDEHELDLAIAAFQKRERRFGRVETSNISGGVGV